MLGLVWLRSGVAAAVCLALAGRGFWADLRRSSRRDRWLMAAIGIALLLSQWCYIAAVERIGVTAATPIALCVPPVLVAVVSALAFGEALTGRLLLALAGALLGTVLLIDGPAGAASPDEGLLPGVLLALAAATAIAAHTLGSGRLAGRHGALLPPAVGFMVAVLAAAALALGRGVSLNQPVAGWLLVLYLGVAPAALASLLFQRGLRHVPASTATIVILVEPLTAAALAWALFGERLGLPEAAGGAPPIASILLLTGRSARASGAAAAAPEA